MKSCNCTLAGTDACTTCPNSWDVGDYWKEQPYTVPVPFYQPQVRNIKRTTKTIEKYGPHGEYLGKEIITTEEDVVEQVWDGAITITTDGSFIGDDTSGDTTYMDPNSCNWSTDPIVIAFNSN